MSDIETINFELILSDLEIIERRIEKVGKLARSGDKESKLEFEILDKVKKHLEKLSRTYFGPFSTICVCYQ